MNVVLDVSVVPTDLIDTIRCHLCRTNIPLYENLKPIDRLKCTAAVGTRGATDERFQFAGLTVGGRGPSNTPQYFPWGNYKFYIEAQNPVPQNQRHLVSPVYEIKKMLHKDDARNPANSICLRSNRERLCELPCLDLVRKALQNPDLRALWPLIVEIYLLADITNVIAYKRPTRNLLYIQARVNCGGLAWFGYREFRDYITKIDPEGVIGWGMFLDLMIDFSGEYDDNQSFYHMAQFAEAVTEIESFEYETRKAINSDRSEDPAVASVLAQLQVEHKYGRANEEWRLEDQMEHRVNWQDEEHELEPPDQ
ncbi:hypothetical protein TWF718_001550 [Orbilia javanica]|uniref:Uncharacterized protein n=1 Tax=Orbilia javanica TaxID=47235 RepID=A0AAN8N8U0_9PEZI